MAVDLLMMLHIEQLRPKDHGYDDLSDIWVYRRNSPKYSVLRIHERNASTALCCPYLSAEGIEALLVNDLLDGYRG